MPSRKSSILDELPSLRKLMGHFGTRDETLSFDWSSKFYTPPFACLCNGGLGSCTGSESTFSGSKGQGVVTEASSMFLNSLSETFENRRFALSCLHHSPRVAMRLHNGVTFICDCAITREVGDMCPNCSRSKCTLYPRCLISNRLRGG